MISWLWVPLALPPALMVLLLLLDALDGRIAGDTAPPSRTAPTLSSWTPDEHHDRTSHGDRQRPVPGWDPIP